MRFGFDYQTHKQKLLVNELGFTDGITATLPDQKLPILLLLGHKHRELLGQLVASIPSFDHGDEFDER